MQATEVACAGGEGDGRDKERQPHLSYLTNTPKNTLPSRLALDHVRVSASLLPPVRVRGQKSRPPEPYPLIKSQMPLPAAATRILVYSQINPTALLSSVAAPLSSLSPLPSTSSSAVCSVSV